MVDEGAEGAATETPSQGTISSETTANTAEWPTGPLDRQEMRQLDRARTKAYSRLVEPLICELHYTDSLEDQSRLSGSALGHLCGRFDQLPTMAGTAR